MKKKAYKILEKITKLHEELKKEQSRCQHKNPTKKYWSTANEYDRLDIRYFTDLSCPDCLKYWTEEGSL